MYMFNMELGKDYYIEGGAIVLTEEYLVNRGRCCGSGCQNCPFEPSVKSSKTFKEYIKKKLDEK